MPLVIFENNSDITLLNQNNLGKKVFIFKLNIFCII